MKTFKKGQKVHYKETIGSDSITENGIVKSLDKEKQVAFVVYYCGGNWEDYEKYTAARTSFKDLYEGWDENADNANIKR